MIKLKLFAFIIVQFLIIQESDAQEFSRAKMDSLLDIVSAKNKAVISISLMQDGKIVYDRAIGFSEITAECKIPSTPMTIYRIGSITKIFTSVMIFQLIEEGKLTLDTHLDQFFPNLPHATIITMENLLNHSSGLHNFTNDPDYTEMLSHKARKTDMLNKFNNQKPDFEPGAKHQYSNTNYILLGYILEKIDHSTYARAVNNRIIKKIGLKQTYYGGKIKTAIGEAQSYQYKGRWLPDTETNMSIPGGAGALVSTPNDLTRFMTALFSDELISSNSLSHMTHITGGYGMDLISYSYANQIGYGHNGGIDGFQSHAVYYPEQKLATAFTANGVNMSLKKLMTAILDIYYGKTTIMPSID